MIFDGVCRILDGVAPLTEFMSREWGGVPSPAGPQGPVPVCAANLPNGAQQGGGRLAAASAQTGSVPLGTGATGRIGASEEGRGGRCAARRNRGRPARNTKARELKGRAAAAGEDAVVASGMARRGPGDAGVGKVPGGVNPHSAKPR